MAAPPALAAAASWERCRRTAAACPEPRPAPPARRRRWALVLCAGVAAGALQPWDFVAPRPLRRAGARARPALGAGGSGAVAPPEVAPAKFETGYAQRALYLLEHKPFLFDSAVDSAIEALDREREQEDEGWAVEPNRGLPPADQLMLRQRMTEVKRRDRVRTVKELLYLKVCSRFKSLGVSLLPPLKEGGSPTFDHMDSMKGLTSDIYSKEALDSVFDHLLMLVDQKVIPPFTVGINIALVPLLQAGRVYLQSALFGYCLRRADVRYGMEKLVRRARGSDGSSAAALATAELPPFRQYFRDLNLSLRNAIDSLEARLAMESHVTALFGELGELENGIVRILAEVESPEERIVRLQRAIHTNEVKSLGITGDDFRRLVLEGVAYGALLYDSEKQVDRIYGLTPDPQRQLDLDESMGEDEGSGRFLNE